MTYDEKALRLHEKHQGKLATHSLSPITNTEELSIAYTPGVAAPCRKIAEDAEEAYRYTLKARTVAVITDGSAVLGLGNIGPEASLPVMEGKCALIKEFAGLDAFPLALSTQDEKELIDTVERLAPTFGAINLEDISAPRCFAVERALKERLDIPVFHDDQHGTAIVAAAALKNALKLTGKTFGELKTVISGTGAAGNAITHMLCAEQCPYLIMVDSKGAIHKGREDLDPYKRELAEKTNRTQETGSLADVIKGADVFIGVSAPGILTKEMVESMNDNPIIFALANPDPEITPEDAQAAGAAIIATGRSDHPNQINNVLAFPGVLKGALEARATDITMGMKHAAAEAIAALVEPTPEAIIPGPFTPGIADAVAKAVREAAEQEGVARKT